MASLMEKGPVYFRAPDGDRILREALGESVSPRWRLAVATNRRGWSLAKVTAPTNLFTPFEFVLVVSEQVFNASTHEAKVDLVQQAHAEWAKLQPVATDD